MCLLVALAGCEKPAVTPQGAAGPGLEAPAVMPLPAKALIGLDKLTPVLPKPVNTEPVRPLSPQASDALAEAEKALAAGDLTKAIDRLERASSFDPTNPKIRRSLGMAYASRGDLGKALDNLRQAVKTAPDDVESQLMIGPLLSSQRRDEEAIIAYRTALMCTLAGGANPLAADALLRLAELLDANGYWTAALDAYTQLGQWVEKYGRNYTARQKLGALILRPERLQTIRGHLLVRLRRPAEAVDPLQKSFETNRTDLATARLLLEALIATRQYGRAEKLLVDLTAETAQGAQLTILAESLCRSAGDPSMPLRIWSSFRKKNNINPALAVALAKISERLGKPDDARAILASVTGTMPGNMPTSNALAGVLARQGQMQEAMSVLSEAVRRNPGGALEIAEGIRQIAATIKPAVKAGDGAARPATGPAKDFAELFVAGMLAQAQGRNEQALRAFVDSAAAKKDFLAAREAQADVHLGQSDFDQAQAVADSLSEKGCFADYLKGKIKLAQNKPVDAVKDFEAARKADGKFVPNLLLLADAYIRQRQTDNALGALEAAIAADPDRMDAYRRKFEIYVATRQYSDAQGVIGRFLDRQPQDMQGLIMLAELNLAINQRPTAVGIIQQLLEQDPGGVEVNLLAARAEVTASPGLVSRKGFDSAMRYLDVALKSDGRNVEALRIKAELLAQPGRFEQAGAVWKQLYDQTNKDEFARNYAAALMIAHKYDLAVAVLEPIAGKSAELSIRMGLIDSLAHIEGGLPKAADILNTWIKEDTAKDKLRVAWDRLRLVRLYGEALLDKKSAAKVNLDDAQKAVDDWASSGDADAKASSVRQKINFFVLAGQYDKAQSAAETISDPDQRHVANLLLAGWLMDNKQFDRAQALLDKLIAAESDKARKERLRGTKVAAWCAAGNFDQAQTYVTAWLKESPQLVVPREYLVVSLMEQNQYDRALKLVESWLAELARPATQTAPAVAPAPPVGPAPGPMADPTTFLQSTHVRLLLLKERFADALKAVDAYLKPAGDDTVLLNLKSTALTELGRHDQSIQVLEKVLSLKPDDPGANNNLGYMYAERGAQLEKAERMLRKALSEPSPDRTPEPSFMDSLGWILYRQGRFNEAAGILREVILDENNDQAMHPVIFNHAGDAYWQLGWTQEAVALWNKALELAQKGKTASSEIRQVIKSASGKIKAAAAHKTPQVAPVAPPPAPAIAPATTSAPATRPASRPGIRPARPTRPSPAAPTTRPLPVM